MVQKIHVDIEERLRHEAMVCRHPPIEYVVGEDGGRVVHRPNPDYAMAELLEDAAKEIERLSHELVEAEGALWRISPRTHTIEVQGDPCSQKPDPFEGPGETYADAYNRVNEELEIWKSVFPDIAPERVLPDRSKLETRLAKLEAVAEAAQVDLDLLRRAISEGDPKAELLIRVDDIKRCMRAALDGEKADG